MQKTIYGRRAQAQYIIGVVITILVLLYWIAPGSVVWIGRTVGNIVVWVVTNLVGMASSLITGLVTAIFG